tara:strand:+ start:225 stop:521 length:297 start_codon:yes stop_codon:yes gene_type:complete
LVEGDSGKDLAASAGSSFATAGSTATRASSGATAAPSAPATAAATSELFDDILGEPDLSGVGNQYRQIIQFGQFAFFFLFLVFFVVLRQFNIIDGESA